MTCIQRLHDNVEFYVEDELVNTHRLVFEVKHLHTPTRVVAKVWSSLDDPSLRSYLLEFGDSFEARFVTPGQELRFAGSTDVDSGIGYESFTVSPDDEARWYFSLKGVLVEDSAEE